jgi:hypothetical protein
MTHSPPSLIGRLAAEQESANWLAILAFTPRPDRPMTQCREDDAATTNPSDFAPAVTHFPPSVIGRLVPEQETTN